MSQNVLNRQALILGALLHDIGKFVQRAFKDESELSQQSKEIESNICPKDSKTQKYTHRHVLWTNEFFEKYKNCFPIDVSPKNTEDNCANFASYHHKPSTPLQMLVQEADYLSAGMDRLESDIKDEITGTEKYKKVRSHSIFEKIDLGNSLSESDKYRYELNPLLPDKDRIFPKLKEELILPEGELLVPNYRTLWNGFIDEFKKLSKSDFNTFLNSIISLLEKYTWCIPSSTIDLPDISLFDHLKTTAAIAICLYEYHKNSLSEENIKDKTKKKFILVGGDLSGIQKYIFNLSHSNIKGVSKRLRARSFYLGALTEVSCHFILHQLNLPLLCNVMNAGGRFILLIPDTEEMKKNIETTYKEISDWYCKMFAGELTLNLDWELELSSDDFNAAKFPEILSQLNGRIEEKKNQKLQKLFIKDKKWNENNFVIEQQFKQGICKSCERNPATKSSENGDINLCEQCFEQEKAGETLLKTKILAYSTQKPYSVYCIPFFDNRYYLSFFENTILNPKEFYLVEELYEPGKQIYNFSTKFLANYVPVFEGKENVEELCFCCDERIKCEVKKEKGKHKTFQCIATKAVIKENDKEIGSPFLAILKADVDRLGLIFSIGLEKQLSISRYATLSRMLNIFFTGYIENLCYTKYKNIYTVYSGGDDLFLIGDWETMISFAKEMYNDFRDFTCQNPDVTLSAGISLIKPNFPIARAAKLAEELLEKSKNEGRNKLTLFDTPVEWHHLGNLFNFGETLNLEFKRKESKIKSAFLYRLLKYHRMYLETTKDKYKLRNLMFHSLMAYDVKRNIEQTEKINGKEVTINQTLIDELRRLYKIPPEDILMKNLKIPLFWVLYKNRGRK